MATQLFRHEVVEAGRDRLAGTVVAATPPGSRLYSLILLGVIAVMVAILIFGGYATSARVRGVVSYDAGIARVYPATQAEVRQIHVRNGMQVAAGAPLVTMSVTQGTDGVAGQLAELARQDGELARQEQIASLLGSTETQSLGQQRASLVAGIASLERQRAIASGQIGLAEAATRRAVGLAREGAGTQRQVEDSRGGLLARRAELESLNERLITQRETLRAIGGQVAQRSIEAVRSQSEIAAQRAALAEQRQALLRMDQLVLTAPVAGEVGDVGVEIGQRARPDASIVTILPRGSKLEVWLYAPSRAVGFIKPGHEVRLLFDAFPYQKYGAGSGTVTSVSRVPIEPGALDANLGIQEPVFRIRVSIDRLSPRAAAAERDLRPGMTLSASLILERRSLWEVFLDPVLKAIRS